MSDIVDELRAWVEDPNIDDAYKQLPAAAADEIERLRSEVEPYRKVAEVIEARSPVAAKTLWIDVLTTAQKRDAEIRRLQGIVDSIPADRLNPWHTVTVHADGWHMAHPISCVLAECPFDGLAQAEWSEPPHAEGVWRWHAFDDEPWEWEADDQPTSVIDEDGRTA